MINLFGYYRNEFKINEAVKILGYYTYNIGISAYQKEFDKTHGTLRYNEEEFEHDQHQQKIWFEELIILIEKRKDYENRMGWFGKIVTGE